MGMCTACSEESVRAKPKRKPPSKAKVVKAIGELISSEAIPKKPQAVAKK
jgi:hypothetical protein